MVETKGREDVDDLRKIKRLYSWCNDVNLAQKDYTYTPVYVKQEKWEDIKNELKSFHDVVELFKVTQKTIAK
jgi:type III restriction enzyme